MQTKNSLGIYQTKVAVQAAERRWLKPENDIPLLANGDLMILEAVMHFTGSHRAVKHYYGCIISKYRNKYVIYVDSFVIYIRNSAMEKRANRV